MVHMSMDLKEMEGQRDQKEVTDEEWLMQIVAERATVESENKSTDQIAQQPTSSADFQ